MGGVGVLGASPLARPRNALLLASAAALMLGSGACTAPVPGSEDLRGAGPQSTGPLRASNGKLFDSKGQEVRLTGVNWFGFETESCAPHGLSKRNWGEMLDQIKSSGFNTIRLPYSNQLLGDTGCKPTGIDYTRNRDLKGLQGLALMDRIVDGATQRGLHVVLDQHRPTSAAQSELWYTDKVPESRWIDDWTMLARHYRGNKAIVGADLHNEPHGPATWGDNNPKTDWRLAAERAGNAILEVNPDWLIVVEGIEVYKNDHYWWGGNLMAAGQHPVRLSSPDKLVYSAHDYGPDLWLQPWFNAKDFPRNLPEVWRKHWGYLPGDHGVPVLLGEFGGRSVGNDKEGQWQRSLVDYLKVTGVSYTYWSWNPDSGDTGGILQDDWKTSNSNKLAVLSAYQWPVAGQAQAKEGGSGVRGAYRL